MYNGDVQTEFVTIELPIEALDLIKETNETKLSVEQILQFMLLERIGQMLTESDQDLVTE